MRTYFTAAEKRPRMEEMVRVATGVEAIPCATPLHAEVVELRLIASHAPALQPSLEVPGAALCGSRSPKRRIPGSVVVREVRDDGATYFGPFRRRQSAEEVVLAIYDGFPIRQCTQRLSPRPAVTGLRPGGDGPVLPPPATGAISVDGYGDLVEQVRTALAADVRPAVRGLRERLLRLVGEQRYEEAATIRGRLDALLRTGVRFHRVRSLAACPEIVAARRSGEDWEIHVIRYGRLAAAGLARPGDVPQAVARAVRATAETVLPPVRPLPAAGIEETERIAAWLEQPGVPADGARRRLAVAAARDARPSDPVSELTLHP